MSKPTFSMNVSLGNIIALVVPLIGIAAAWGQMSMRVDNLTRERAAFTQRLLTEIRDATQSRADLEQRLRLVEQQNIRIDERFSLILSTMTDLRSQVAALSKERSK